MKRHHLFHFEDLSRRLPISICEIRELQGGRINALYRLFTEDREKSWVLRISLRGDIDALHQEALLHVALAAQGICCPHLVKNRDMDSVLIVRDRSDNKEYPALLMNFVNGSYPSTADDLRLTGTMLGRLHNMRPPAFLRKGSGFHFDTVKQQELPQAFYEQMPRSKWVALLSRLEVDRGEYRVAVCHGDLFPNNVIIDGKSACFIDFENSGLDFALFDLGMALFGHVTGRGTEIDENKVHHFLTGYEAVRPLLKKEREHLYEVAAVAGIKISLWRYQRLSQALIPGMPPDAWSESLEASMQWLNLHLQSNKEAKSC